MSKFNEGDYVRVRSNSAAGVIAYAEDGYYSVELLNGAEQDFENADDLMSEDDYLTQCKEEQAERDSTRQKSTGDVGSALFGMPYVPRKGDRKVAAAVIESIKTIYPTLLEAMEVKSTGFAKLDAFDQVQALSEYTGTPMVVFMGAADFGGPNFMEQVLQKTILNNLFDQESTLVKDMLLRKVRRLISEHEGNENG